MTAEILKRGLLQPCRCTRCDWALRGTSRSMYDESYNNIRRKVRKFSSIFKTCQIRILHTLQTALTGPQGPAQIDNPEKQQRNAWRTNCHSGSVEPTHINLLTVTLSLTASRSALHHVSMPVPSLSYT